MAVEEAFLRQPEWAARERKAPTGPEGKGELETRRKWPKSRVSARKGGFGPEEGGGDVKGSLKPAGSGPSLEFQLERGVWARRGGGGRREVGKRRRGKTRKRTREHDFSVEK